MEIREIEVRDGVTKFPDKDEGAIQKFDKSLTRQSEARQTDINFIMAQYEKNGTLPISQVEGMFEDVSEVGSYREMLDAVRVADEAFMSLPAKVRSHFDNNPALLLDAMNDESRRQELVDLGVINPPAVSGGGGGQVAPPVS